MTHSYSIEYLYHFKCGACSQWWTIGDCQLAPGEPITCPRCRTSAAAEEMPSFCSGGLEQENATPPRKDDRCRHTQ